MHLKAYYPLRNLFKTTKFWQDNYLILREFKYFPKIVVLAIVFTFLAAVLEGSTVGLLLSFLQNLTNPNATPIHTGIEWVDIWILGVKTSAISRLYRVSLLILFATWVRAAFNYLGQIHTEFAQVLLSDRLRKQIFEQLQSLPLSFFAKTRAGEIINTITTEIERIKQTFSSAAFLISRLLNVCVYLVTMCILSWQLTLLSVLLGVLVGTGLRTLNAKVRERSFSTTAANGRFTSTAIEFINAVRTVQAFCTQEFERQRYYRDSDNVVDTTKKVISAWALVRPITEAISSTVLISMLILAFTIFVSNGTLQVASLLTFFFALFRLVPIVQDVNGMFAYLNTLRGSTENIKDLLRTDNKTYMPNGQIAFHGLKRSIDLVSVDFAYYTNNPVLKNITLTIERGKMTALVGQSGSGKSTLVDLIPRFQDVTAGQLLLDGVDVRQFDLNSLRAKIAVVSQDTFIFNTSVWDNIAYGSPSATSEEIREAAGLANALEFIEAMPEGFDTQLGDRGVNLSGGQRQRIAIARALLRNPEILILDEATSALDSVSERLIQQSLDKLAVGRTVIAIAHRLSTIAQADKVVVLEQGCIVEQGKYQELLEQRGKLWKYHKMQYESGQFT